MGRRRAVLAIVLGATCASIMAPAPSLAGTVSSDGSDVRYTAAAGEQNNVTVDLNTGTSTYTITDTGPGVTLTVNSPCAPAGATSATCPESALPNIDHVTVVGGDMNDTIKVNALSRDGTRIDGGAGDDTIVGSKGADKITGGTGDDTIDPNDVSNVDYTVCDPVDFSDFSMFNCPDIIDGEAGFNTLRFDNQPNGVVIDGGTRGPDPESVIDPTRPQNGDTRANLLAIKGRGWRFSKLIGTPQADQIFGSAFDDTIIGRGGADVLCGGFGEDTVDYSGSGGPVNVSLDTNLPPDNKWTSTNAQVRSFSRGDCRQTNDSGVAQPTAEKDCIANDGEANEHDCVGVDVEDVIGSPSGDSITGSDPGPFVGVAAFFEPRGVNRLNGGGGDDTLDGGLGADALIGGPGVDTVSYARETLPVAVSLDGAANDGSTLDQNPDSGLGDSVGTDVENIVGGSGDDTLVGSAKDNVIQGGPGNDVIQGGAGDDNLDGGDGNDYVQGQDGNDPNLQGGNGDDVLDGGLGADTFDGGPGEDAVDYSNNTTSVISTPDGVANDGNNSGAEGDNVLNTIEDLFGGSANDTLVGNDGNGVLDGGPGNDTLDGGGGSDLIVGGDGIDNASYAGRAAPVTVDLAAGTGGAAGENDTLQQIEQVTGGGGNDSIAGNDDLNILDGGPGNDTIDGRGGDDQIFGGAGNDTLAGGAGNDTISGDAGDDNLQGGDGADTLNGGDGNDQLDGGAAADVLTGGPGDDTAVYTSRKKDVSVTLDGADNDGEASEKDQVRVSVESTKTGAGNDSINVRDGLKGEVACGAGRDVVTADRIDTVARDCEQTNLAPLATCSIRSGSVKMSSKGVISVRVSCPTAGKAKLTLQTAGAYKAKKTRKKVKLGSKSFSVKAGKAKTVKLKLSKKARRLVKKNKRLHAKATLSVNQASAAKAVKRSKTLTIQAPKRKKR